MDYKDIVVNVQDSLATVTLNRPQKLNAYTSLMGEELTHAYETLGKRDDVRVIIMTGAGRGFCSGADVSAEFQKNITEREQEASSSSSRIVHPRSGLHYALRNCPKPTIAAINGPAVGIGLTLTLLQDIRVMAEEASVGAIFARMGLMPELGSTFMLPRLVGLAKALELTYTARIINAAEALEIGLVNRVVPGAGLTAAVREMASHIAALPPLALAVSKRALYQGAENDFDAAVQTETFGLDYLFKTQDHKEAVAAFLERRPAKFQGK
ncbi:MAG: enoyl-CoA hydratase-related protein [Thermodesulfobacteriota bacterium]|jgi:enoyl-CoA hydratase/carnithine racemase